MNLLGALLIIWVNFNPSMGKYTNYIHYNVAGEITYPFPNFNGAAVEVWQWISDFIHTLLGMWLLIRAAI